MSRRKEALIEKPDELRERGKRSKHQIPNTKLQIKPAIETPKTKLQTPKKSQVPSSKPRHALRAWNLEPGAICRQDAGSTLGLTFKPPLNTNLRSSPSDFGLSRSTSRGQNVQTPVCWPLARSASPQGALPPLWASARSSVDQIHVSNGICIESWRQTGTMPPRSPKSKWS